jgi:uncharacterized repeat protein (TIGR01451 family)
MGPPGGARPLTPRQRQPRALATGAAAVAASLGLVAGLVGTLVVTTPAPASAATTGATCSFANAGSGPYARTLCWFDLSGYNATAAGSAAGQGMSVALPGGYTISFTLKVSGGPVKAVAFPTYGGAYLGNGAYTGVAGKPALYQTQTGTTTTAALSAITVVDSQGNPVTGYSFVGADAESTDSGESITWTSDQVLNLISNIGNACNSGALLTGVGSTTVKCSATTSSTKTGTAVLAAEHPATFSQTMVGAGLQAVAFGVLVSTVQLNKTVASRINPSDAFALSVSSSTGSLLGSANTGTANSATTGQVTVLSGATGENYTLSESATSGLLSDYNASWSCSRNGATDPTLPSGPIGPSATVTLGIGDFVNCTITNTAKVASLALLKQAATPVDVNQDGITDAGDTIAYSFVVTNTGVLTLNTIAVSDPTLGPVSCPRSTLLPGDSETCTGTNVYTVTAADVAAGAVVDTATATGLAPGGMTPVRSSPSSVSTPTQAPAPAVSLTKTANASGGDTHAVTVGETIAYSYLVTNTGNVNLTSISVSDPTEGPVNCPLPPAPGLAPGASETCTANTPYTVTQADVDRGSVVDTATATGTAPGGVTSTPSAPSTATVTGAAPAPAVAVEKTAQVSPTGDEHAARVGDTIAYSYLVTNTGNVTLTSVAVDDSALGPVTCPAPASSGLAPGAAETCTANATYTVTQADVDRGAVSDTATATGTDSAGVSSPASAPSTATVPTVSAAPAVSVTKTGTVSPPSDQGAAQVGDTIAYSYLVTNTGNVTLASVAVDDATLGAVSCPTPASPGLAAGASETCTADQSYTVTQANVDSGDVVDSATATGTDSQGEVSPPSNPSTSVIETAPDAPAVSLAKTATVSPAADQLAAQAGDTIAYSYLVTNTGNVTLRSVAVNDPTLGSVTCPTPPAPGLAPGDSKTCTADNLYTVTQADVDAGSVSDTATATGTDTQGNTSPPSAPSTATVQTVAPAPAVSMAKTATVNPAADQGAAQLGDTIAYSYLVTNTGNVTLASVAVNDSSTGSVTCPTPPAPGLAPGASETCVAVSTYRVTQADVDVGNVTDTATATGTDTQGVTSPPSTASTATVPTVAASPAVSLAETGVTSGGDGNPLFVGETIAYSYLVTNSGNVTMASVAVNDPAVGPITCPPPAAPGLAPGASETCTADTTYVVTQADVDRGSVSDSAIATGTDAQGTASPPSSPSTFVASGTPDPEVLVHKSAHVTPTADQAAVQMDDTIAYRYQVTNVGNVTLKSVAVDDPALGHVTCPTPAAPGLAPGASETCTGDNLYTVTQADVDAGSVVDTATATGTDAEGGTSPPSGPSTVMVPAVAPAPAVSMTKTGAVAPTGDQNAAKVGDTVAYSYVVTNTGNVTLVSVTVDDPALGHVTCPTPAAPGLAPGASETCTADNLYTVTQADVDAGSVVDTATATGTDTQGNASPPSGPSTATIDTATAAPAVSVAKTASVAPTADQHAAQLGDTISYSYRVTNEGNVTLASVAVNDPSVRTVTCPTPGAPGLAPGASETCAADSTYRVTQADIDGGKVVDVATATGTDTQGDTSPPSAPSTVTVPTVAAAPSVSVAKIGEASGGDGNPLSVGETISYSYLITNTGNVTLASLAVNDPSLGPVTCPVPPVPGLAPGDQETCRADNVYTVTQADVDHGSVSDTATATGTDTRGTTSPASAPSTFVVSGAPLPKVVVHKSAQVTPAADQDAAQLGDTIAYTYDVTNVGNVTLASVSVADPTIGNVTCPAPAAPGLAPGASETCSADTPYMVAQSDIDNGKVVDTATATGTDALGATSPPSDPSTATIQTALAAPSVSLAKMSAVSPATDQDAAQAGDTIAYSYLVTNTGNVTLTSVAVDDPALGPTTCPTPAPPGLAPGSAETCTAGSTYTVTQADVDRGFVSDTATATGIDTKGDASPPSGPSTATTETVTPAPAVSVVKSADASGGDSNPIFAGETISYSYLVTNTGNVTLTSVAVDDPTLGPVTCPPPTVRGLVPNASETCAANSAYTVTQANVDRGSIADTATATGVDTHGDDSPVSEPSTVVVPSSASATTGHAGSGSSVPGASTSARPSPVSPTPAGLGTTTTAPGPKAKTTRRPREKTKNNTAPGTKTTTTGGGPGPHPTTTATTAPKAPTAPAQATPSTVPGRTITHHIRRGTKAITTKPTTTGALGGGTSGDKTLTPKTITVPPATPTAAKTGTGKRPTNKASKTTSAAKTKVEPTTPGGASAALRPAGTTSGEIPGKTATAKTTSAKAAGSSSSAAATAPAANGLGRISTDLGRWTPRKECWTWAVAAGMAAAAAGTGVMGARRRRRLAHLNNKGRRNAS